MDERLEDHIGSVYRFALRLTGRRQDAEDLTQEAFLRAWAHRHRAGGLRSARSWLLCIAGNLWRDGLRRRRRREGPAGPLPEEPAAGGASSARMLEEREEVQMLLEAVERLPPRQREVIHLCALEGLSGAEAADVLGIEEGAVRTNLCLARRSLRESLRRIHRGGERS